MLFEVHPDKGSHFRPRTIFPANDSLGHELPRLDVHLPRTQSSDPRKHYSGMRTLRFVQVNIFSLCG